MTPRPRCQELAHRKGQPMKIKFSVIAKTLEEAKERAQEEIERFTDHEGELVVVSAVPEETISEMTVGGAVYFRILTWEVDFECTI